MAAYDSFQVSDELKHVVVEKMIEPSYKTEISENIKLRKNFKRLGLTFEVTSKIFLGISTIVSFSAGIYKYPILAFLSGTASTVSLVFMQFSSFSYREAKKSASELNIILKKLNIEQMADSIIGASSQAFCPPSPSPMMRGRSPPPSPPPEEITPVPPPKVSKKK